MTHDMGTRAAVASAGAVLMLALAAFVLSLTVRAMPPVEVTLAAPLPALPLPKVDGRTGRPLLVIDAGHGGHDPGAVAGALTEKAVTLAVALAIRDAALAGGRLRVALTRGDDRYLLLGERPEIARALRADLFVSVHADSGGGTGASVYTLSQTPSDPKAAMLAARENRGSDAGDEPEVAAILGDLANEQRLGGSLAFAERLHATGGLPFKADWRRSANFVVLRGAASPAVLVEVGYMSAPADVARLRSVAGRAAIGQAVASAADRFLATRK